jgi:hypothetical protein
MPFDINTLLDKILFELKILNPLYCRQPDDPRIDTYYISINQHNYIILYGTCDECDNIIIYNNNNINHDIMTTQGIKNFVYIDENIIDDISGNIINDDNINDENIIDENIDDNINDDKDEKVIFELELDTFEGNMDDLILLIKNTVKKIVPF